MKSIRSSLRWTSLIAISTMAITVSNPAFAGRKSFVEKAIIAVENNSSTKIAAAGSLEIAFSPNEGGENLIIRVLESAKSEIRVLAYSFTSAPIVDAILRAKKRGVNIQVVADYKSNVQEDKSGKSRAALSSLVNAGIDVRTISAYAIHHDKVICVDRVTVELGSFNYSAAAASRNSENVLVNWNNPQLAKTYLAHFERNYKQSDVFTTRY